MILVPDESFDDDVTVAPYHHQLTSTLPEHVGSWLLMDKQFITILSADQLTSNDEYDAVLVEMLVRHDGDTDLPSAMAHMKRLMHMGRCRVPVGAGFLAPQPESLETEHKFSFTARREFPIIRNLDNGMYEDTESLFEYCRSHNWILIVAGTLSVFILVSIVVISVMVSRRRRNRNGLNFEHQRLQNQISVTSSEKSLLEGKDDSALLVSVERLDEDKTPLA
jgi:hypothetical protein